jgi:uncharacterized DUF497 family protein
MMFDAALFEWDPEKSNRNEVQRGFGFDYASLIFKDEVLVTEDRRRNYGEDRFVATGTVDEKLLVVVFTWREDRVRIISARAAKGRERDAYRKTFTA